MILLLCAFLSFQQIDDHPFPFSTEPSMSVSATKGSRETLYLDPSNCPHLQESYKNFIALLERPLPPEEVAFALTNYISSAIFYPENAHDDAVFALVNDNFMDLDIFVENHTGLCRHHAYATAYIIDRLQIERPPLFPKGKVSIVRKTYPRGKHAFCLYVSDDKTLKLIIDSMWGIVKKSFERDSMRNDEGLSLNNGMMR